MAKIKFNEKKYLERRSAILAQLQTMVDGAEAETRAFTEEEQGTYTSLMTEMRSIDQMLQVGDETRSLEEMSPVQQQEQRSQEELEIRAFDAYIRGLPLETRAEEGTPVNMTRTDNGVIIPASIARRIIEKVKEKAPIFARATTFNVKGDLTFPVYDESTQKVTAAYADEFKALTSTSGKFTAITLKGHLAGVLSKVSKSLVNNSTFDLVSFVVEKVAEAMADFLRGELLIGTKDKMTGLSATTNLITAASATAITADELIDLQMEIPQQFQPGAAWVMSRNTFKAIRKLKDGNGNYLLNKDATKAFGWDLLGNEVMVDEKMPDMAAGKTVIFYADISGLYVKLVEAPNVEILREKYADEHALGVIAWVEADSNIVEPQKVAALAMKAAASGG